MTTVGTTQVQSHAFFCTRGKKDSFLVLAHGTFYIIGAWQCRICLDILQDDSFFFVAVMHFISIYTPPSILFV